MSGNLRTAIARFLEDAKDRVARSGKTGSELEAIESQLGNVRAYLTNDGFVSHLLGNWHGPDLVVAIIEGEDGNVRGSLVKRADAFSFSNMTDRFAPTARLIMSADKSGVLFQELGPIPEGSA